MPLKVQRDDQTAINLTPMIDIVFLLIIFFMVSSHFTNKTATLERDIAIRVPQVSDGGAMTAPPRHRVINIFDNGQIALGDDNVTLTELESKLIDARAQYEQLGVVVRGDKACKYEHVAKVIATCEDLRIRTVNITVQNLDTLNR